MSAEEQVKYLCLLLLDGLHGLASVNVGNLAIRGLECHICAVFPHRTHVPEFVC